MTYILMVSVLSVMLYSANFIVSNLQVSVLSNYVEAIFVNKCSSSTLSSQWSWVWDNVISNGSNFFVSQVIRIIFKPSFCYGTNWYLVGGNVILKIRYFVVDWSCIDMWEDCFNRPCVGTSPEGYNNLFTIQLCCILGQCVFSYPWVNLVEEFISSMRASIGAFN